MYQLGMACDKRYDVAVMKIHVMISCRILISNLFVFFGMVNIYQSKLSSIFIYIKSFIIL